MKYSKTMMAGLAMCVFLAACDDGDPVFGGGTRANVRFANATADVAGLNFTVNGAATASGQNLVFGTPSPCASVNSGSTTFGATPVGATTTFGTTFNQNLVPGGNYTVLATGSATAPTFMFLNDAAEAPVSGRARLRVINLVPGVTASDVYVTAPDATLGTASATNIGVNTATTFLDVPAGPTQIRFTSTGTQTVTYTGTAFDVAAGSTRTVVIAPGITPGTFRTFVIEPCD